MKSVFCSLATMVYILLISLSVEARPYPGQTVMVAAADSAATAGTNPAGISRFKSRTIETKILTFFSANTWEGDIGVGDSPVNSPTIPGLGSVTGEYTSRDIIQLEIGMTMGKGR